VERVTWRDLSHELNAARATYLELRSLPSDPSEADRASYQFVSWLSDVNDCMVRGDIPSTLRTASMLVPPEYEEQKSVVLRRCQQAALSEVERLEEESRWPDELEKAEAILSALKASSVFSPEMMPRLAELDERIGQWRGILSELRRSLTDLGADFPKVPYEVLLDPSRKGIDDVLQEAIDYRIEVFERTGLPAEMAAQLSVQSLLTARRAKRLFQDAKACSDELTSIAVNMKAQTGELQGNLESLDTTLRQYRVLQIKLKDEDIVPELKRTEQLLKNLDVVAEEMRGASERWPGLLQQSETLQGQIKALEATIPTTLDQIDSVEHTLLTAREKVEGLREKREALAREKQPVPQGDVYVREVSPAISPVRSLLDEFEQQKKTGDDPSTLQQFHERLSEIRRIRDLSAEELDQIKDLADWCDRRDSFTKKARELVEQWDQLENQLRASPNDHQQKILEEVLGKTNDLVIHAPSGLPAVYWEGLGIRLQQAYDNMTTQNLYPPNLIVWLGILHFRVDGRIRVHTRRGSQYE